MTGFDLLNVLALVVSVAAFATSIFVARRQLKLTQDSNVLPIIIDVFKETRTLEFSRSIEFVRDELSTRYRSDDGYRNLPEQAKVHIRRVGLFYDDVGKLVAHQIVDEQLVLGSYGAAVVKMWDRLAPFVYAERQRHGNWTMAYFEDLASRAHGTTMRDIHRNIRLRRRPPAMPQ
ncbi:DUF4760 domain-containing protein [Streptomyces mirabilis]